MLSGIQIVEWKIWEGGLTDEQQVLLSQMNPTIDDMNRPDDPIIYLWYEHTQWKWKQWEYGSVLSRLDLGSPQGRKVLDAGCGYTPLIRYLASIGMEAYGFDWDVIEQESSLAMSSSLLYGDLVKYQKQDIRAMRCPANFFDYTISVSVIEHLFLASNFFQKVYDKLMPPPQKYFHLQNVRRALQELVRVTKPGGLIVLTLDCGYGSALRRSVLEKLFDISISSFPTVEEIRSYWEKDDYFTHNTRYFPTTPREWSAFFIVLRKIDDRP